MKLEREPGEFKQLGASLAALAGIGALGYFGAWGAALQLGVGGSLLARWYLKKSDPGILISAVPDPAHLTLPERAGNLRPAVVAPKRVQPRENPLLALRSPEFYFIFGAMAALTGLFDMMGAAASETLGRAPEAYATAFSGCTLGALVSAGVGILVAVGKKLTASPEVPPPHRTAGPTP